MKLKEFFKPTTGKIILLIVFFGLSYFFVMQQSSFTEATFYYHGLPFPYYVCTSSVLPTGGSYSCSFRVGLDVFPYYFLIIDILIWYLISCSIIFGYDKFKKKK
jgi:hypothetical protein